jgi:hypothetical protein
MPGSMRAEHSILLSSFPLAGVFGRAMRSVYKWCLASIGGSLACELFSLSIYKNFPDPDQLNRVIFVAVVLLGLLLLSQAARFIGLIFIGGSAAHVGWLAVSTPTRAPSLVIIPIVLSAVLGLVAAYFLGASKMFSLEFAEMRMKASPSMALARRIYIYLDHCNRPCLAVLRRCSTALSCELNLRSHPNSARLPFR